MEIRRIEELDVGHRLQLLVEGVVDYAIYLVSLDGNIISWNSGARRLKGYEPDEIIGKPFDSFFTEEDRANGLPTFALHEAKQHGRFESEGWRVRKDGTRFWALAVVDAVKDESGEVIGFAKITRDMTEREKARQSLVESEARFRQLVEAVVDYAIFQLDPNGIVVTWNAGAERIKGYKAEEIIGQHFSRFYSEEDRQAGVPQQALATAANEGRFEAEAWRVRKDGSKFVALVIIDPIRDDKGELIGFAKVTRDVTERITADRRLKEAQEQLAASQRLEAVGQLSGGIAHDFNNLLMIVMGNLETATRHLRSAPNSNPNIERAIGNATRGAQRAAALTSRLLAFSRRQPLDPKPLDVNRYFAGAAEFLQRSLGEMVDVQFVGSAGVWQIEADASQLESSLVNLAINSRDAMPNGGAVTIEASNIYADEGYCRQNPEVSPGQYVLIAVSDQGSGMAPDVASHAFEPFFTTKEVGHGTGLGLSQVYGFVKQSGGHVKIYSESGLGTTVKIYLPRYRGKEDQADKLVNDEPIGHGDGETILVVEDNEEVRAYVTEVLRDLGYRVRSVNNGEAALAIIEQRKKRLDLLLTDVVMPGLNGAQLGKRAKEIRPELPILYMTGYTRNAIVHQGRLDEGVQLLQKPISQNQLAARVRDLLDGNGSIKS